MSRRLCSHDADPAVFTPEECDRIRALGAALALLPGQTNDDAGGNQQLVLRRNCTLRWVKRGVDGWDWVFERVNERMHALNGKRWGFALRDVEAIQYTSYRMGEFYAAHFDNGSKATEHRKLSLSVQLSAPNAYLGGALRLWSMNERPSAPKDLGSMTCFPSYLRHVAKPVIWGHREVLVAFAHGDEPLR